MKKLGVTLFNIGKMLAMASCAFTSYQSRANYVTTRAIIATPVLGDVKVDFTKKVTGEPEASKLEPAKEASL